MAVLRYCELFVWKIEHQESTVLSFLFFSCNHRRSQGGNETIPPKFLTYLAILWFDRQCPNKIPLLALSHSIWPSQKNFGLATLLLVTTFIQTTCVALAPSHVPQYQTFDTALLYLMFSLPLAKSSQQCKTTRHCHIIILILRSKQYYRVVTVLIVYTRERPGPWPRLRLRPRPGIGFFPRPLPRPGQSK